MQYDHQQYPHSDLTNKIIRCAIEVHKKLGPGFVEKIYQRALYLELKLFGIKFDREYKLPIIYNNVSVGYSKVDFIFENKVLVELKATPKILDIHRTQLWSYLKASGCKVGLIINFGRQKIDIKRIVN